MDPATRHPRTEDFAAWAFETAELIQQRRFDEIDQAALVEETRGLARSEYNWLRRQMWRLLFYLLKWEYQTDKRSVPWEVRILRARHEIERVLKYSPSLRLKIATEIIGSVWQRARKRITWEMGLYTPPPETCPWDRDTQILRKGWLP